MKNALTSLRHTKTPGLVGVGIVLLGLALALRLRFVQDDAFISFRYAQHLSEGHGLVWNIGEPPIEGFTNMLYVVLLAGLFALGVEAVRASFLIGILSFLLTVGALLGLTRARFGESRDARLLRNYVLLMTVTNVSFAAYATGGLETQLVTALTLHTWFWSTRERAAPLAFVCAALAIWTRMDAVLLVFIPLARALRAPTTTVPARRLGLALFALGISSLLGLKWHLFHDIVPNTFHAKVPHSLGRTCFRGLEYLMAYASQYGAAWALVFVCAWAITHYKHGSLGALLGARGRAEGLDGAILATCILWCAYLVWVGGDFMEFRFLVPLVPLGAILLISAVSSYQKPLLVHVAALATCMQSALYYYDTYDEPFLADGHAIETVHGLSEHLSKGQWRATGERLREIFGDGSQVTISAGAAGAIPFYSGLRTIDEFGLNDRWIAKHGDYLSDRPGHGRVAPLAYLVEQRVNLALGRGIRAGDVVPEGARWVEFPMHDGTWYRALYLTPHAEVEAAIRRDGFRTSPATGP
jgi:arabinofuranosyltransferase